MTAEKLIRSAVAEAYRWWDQIGDAIDSGDITRLDAVSTASASSIGLATAIAWVRREYPDRADELAQVVRWYADNGGDDHGVLAGFLPEEGSACATTTVTSDPAP